jgi:hypothetical protein
MKTELPWHDSKKWKYGNWYPLPNLSHWSNSLEAVDSYKIYKLDADAPLESGDIEPVVAQRFILREAIFICEAHNQELFNVIASECRS